MGWLASLTLEDEGRKNLGLPQVVCEYKDVEFFIELHSGTSPISMTPHRMAPVELHELKV